MSSSYHIRISVSKNRDTSNTFKAFQAAVPKSIFDTLPKHTSSPISKRRDTLPTGRRKDYRYGPISIDWIDFSMMNGSESGLSGIQHAQKGKAEAEERSTPTALFIPALNQESGSTNLPEGVVHIFRERPREEPRPGSPSTSSNAAQSSSSAVNATSPVKATLNTVAVLAVPPWMTPSDFLAFVSPAAEGMKHLRLIRDISPNRSMVVIQFREEDNAVEFIEAYNGKQFNAIEPETCNVVRVNSVEIDAQDPVSVTIGRNLTNPPSSYELPTCPVCLDRMDTSVTGLITVPCSHTFHCMCLSKWGDSRCPVCRYSQLSLSSPPSQNTPGSIPFSPPPEGSRLATCVDCSSTFNLWICLICGNVGCGRQGRAHAKGHYDLTTHPYAMDLQTQRVWDYHGDNYVHRLIQNKADGKLVELPSASGLEEGRSRAGPGDDDNLKAEKMEILAMQYSQILQRTMEEQRSVYEEQTRDLRRRLEDTQKKLEIMGGDSENKAREVREEFGRYKKEGEEKYSQLEKEKAKAEKKAEKLSDLARRLEKDLREERSVSEGLLKNLSLSKEKIETVVKEKNDLATRVTDLEEQMRDLMFFLEARERIEKEDGVASEAAGGTLGVLPSDSARSNTGGRRKKKK